jgi:hypothetical protein
MRCAWRCAATPPGWSASWPAGAAARGVDQELEVEVAEPWALELAGDHARAAGRWTTLGCPYDAALALAGSNDEAELRRALDTLLRLGATAPAAIVARRLRERGAVGLPRGPHRATRQNPAQLTARELEVLTLVADGFA